VSYLADGSPGPTGCWRRPGLAVDGAGTAARSAPSPSPGSPPCSSSSGARWSSGCARALFLLSAAAFAVRLRTACRPAPPPPQRPETPRPLPPRPGGTRCRRVVPVRTAGRTPDRRRPWSG